MQTANKQRKPKYGRTVFFVACTAFILFGFVQIMAKPDPYKRYKNVSEETKLAGEKKELFQESSEEKAKFFHYPKFGNETMDQAVLDLISALPDESGITLLDYDSYKALDAYTSVLFHYQLFDQEQNLQTESWQSISFSNKDGAQVHLDDVLRRDYTVMLKDRFQKEANISLDSFEAVNVAVGDDAILLIAENMRISLPYEEIRNYVKLPGKGISETTLKIQRELSIDPDKPMIALTYDDGPSGLTDEFMSVFEENKATASFFMLGKNVQKYPDTVKHMYEYGFELCNHSWDHRNISSDDQNFISQEIFDTQDAIFQLTGHEPTKLRPPYGAYNELTSQIAEHNGIDVTLWNIDTEDWKSRNASAVLECAKNGARDGAIILFHDLYSTTLEATKELVPYLQNEGYQLVTVSDLLKYKKHLAGL